MKKVTLTFIGDKSDEIADSFYTWALDGGLENGIIETLTNEEIEVTGIKDFNNSSLDIAIESKFKK